MTVTAGVGSPRVPPSLATDTIALAELEAEPVSAGMLRWAWRQHAWLLTGQERTTGAPLRLFYAGTDKQRAFFSSLAFRDTPALTDLGDLPFWRIRRIRRSGRMPRSLGGAPVDLAVVEGHAAHQWLYGRRGDYAIPVWIRTEVELPLRVANRSVAEDLRRIRKYGLGYEVTREAARVERFYQEAYLPSIEGSHGDSTVVVPWRSVSGAVERGDCELLAVTHEGRDVAGVLIRRQDPPRLWCGGVWQGDPTVRKMGAASATYWFAGQHLTEQGHRRMHMGLSRAFLRDGVLQFKAKWGHRITGCTTDRFLLRPLADTDATRAFLTANPFVARAGRYLVGPPEAAPTPGSTPTPAEAARSLLVDVLGLEPGERLLCYADAGRTAVAERLQAVAGELGAVAEVLPLDPAEDTDRWVAQLRAAISPGACDLVCELTTRPLYLTGLFGHAIQSGARIYTCGGLDDAALVRCYGAVDQAALRRLADALHRLLLGARRVRITSPAGTELSLRLNGRGLVTRLRRRIGWLEPDRIWAPSGWFRDGTRATFPAGQLSFRGRRSSMRGRLVVDGYFWPPEELGVLATPVVLKVERGRVTRIEGAAAPLLEQWWEADPKQVEHLCFGFHPHAGLEGELTEAERAWAHVNVGIGAHPRHADGVIRNPTVTVDGQVLLTGGTFPHPELAALAAALRPASDVPRSAS